MARKRNDIHPSGETILVIDDQEEILTSVRHLLERRGHTVLTTLTGAEGVAFLQDTRVQLVIVDYFMPEMTGEDVVREIRKIDPDVQILLQTGYSGEKPPLETMQELDIQGYHSKTDGPEHLLLWVDALLKANAHLQKVREMEQLKAELLMKQQFLVNASHAMRTPLHIILGYSELLLAEPQEEMLSFFSQTVEAIQRQGHSLLDLVTNFLSFATLETEGHSIKRQPVWLVNLRQEFQEMMALLLRNRPVTFAWQEPSSLPPIFADPEKLRLILRNLLVNAARFTTQGEICLSAHVAPAGDKITIGVADSGIGIAPEHHESIFELFRQANVSSSDSTNGIGIGLPLARKLARLMGGDISVTSSLGTGACFVLTLPVAVVPQQSQREASSLVEQHRVQRAPHSIPVVATA
jgi:signal transduction histidine kinase